MTEINTRTFFSGINARRANVSTVSPSSVGASPVTTDYSSAETILNAFQDNAFQEDAFQ